MAAMPGDRAPAAGAPSIQAWPDVAAGLFAAAFFVFLAIPGPLSATGTLIDNLFFVPPGIAVAWMSWRTSRLWPHDGATRRGWALFALSTLVYWFFGTIFGALLTWAPVLARSAWVELLSLVSYPLALVAILTFPGVYDDGESRARFRLDLTLILLGCALGSWYFSFLPAASAPTASDALSTFIYPEGGSVEVDGRWLIGSTRPFIW